MSPVISKIAGMCGQSHIILLLLNFVVIGVSIGVVYGVITTKVDNLRDDIFRERESQIRWNEDERKQDQLHRERMDAIQADNLRQDQIHRDKMDMLQLQIINMLKEMKK